MQEDKVETMMNEWATLIRGRSINGKETMKAIIVGKERLATAKSRSKANDGWRTAGRVATESRLGAGRVGSQARIRLIED